MSETVIVFGGTGFVGKNLQKVKPEWVYVGRDIIEENGYKYPYGVDLLDAKQVDAFFDAFAFEKFSVINLAAIVGGIKFNKENQLRMLYENIEIGKNIFEYSKKNGVSKIVSSLSTCALPDLNNIDHKKRVKYPLDEQDLFIGTPPWTNLGYAYAKKILQFESDIARQEGINSVTFTPSNLYGPYDHFSSEDSHFVASFISKLENSKNGDEIELWGSGREMRQQLYVKDLVRAIVGIYEEYDDISPLFVSPDENLTIKQLAQTMIEISGKKDIILKFNGDHPGQIRKDVSNKRLKTIFPDFKFTPFSKGVAKTYSWYKKNKAAQ